MENDRLAIAIFGASGRLGAAIASLAGKDARFRVAALLVHPQSKYRGTAPFTTELPEGVQLLIDASLAAGCEARIQMALERRLPLVIGTTGLSPAQRDLLGKASERVPVLYAPNFSLGMALLQRLAAEVAQRFPADVDILETHRKGKKDAPSGSALLLAEAMERRGAPTHSIRSGETLGEHTVLFNNGEERLTLSHTVHSRVAFAKGALEAALFLSAQPPGLYAMQHVGGICTPCV